MQKCPAEILEQHILPTGPHQGQPWSFHQYNEKPRPNSPVKEEEGTADAAFILMRGYV